MYPRLDGQCYICQRTEGVKVDRVGFGNGPNFDCPVCGRYGATVALLAEIDLTDELRPALSAATRKATERTPESQVLLTKENYLRLAAAHHSPVSEKIDQLLFLLAQRCQYPGRVFRLKPALDYPLIEARSPEEMYSYLGHFNDTGLAKWHFVNGETGGDCSLLVPGWQRIEPIRKVGGAPGTCFVAMSFSAELSDAYEFGIRPAIEEDCGLKALRVDRKEHNNQITDEIMAGIRNAEFMVADFTGNKAGVYYEAGFARGLGRDVIHCCHDDDFGNRHFDTSVINHVKWTAPADLRVKLARRIQGSILPKG